MARRRVGPKDDTAVLLKHILAIELWRSGVSQADIRTRLGLSMNTVNEMLKGVPRALTVKVKEEA